MTIAAHVDELRRRHESLQNRIETELQSPAANDLDIVAMKKQKLRLKEQIERLGKA